MAIELLPHQRKAVNRMGYYMVEKEHPYFFLNAATGTGKTAMAVGLASSLYKRGLIKRVLVIAPNTVHKQWVKEEIPKFCTEPYEASYYSAQSNAKERRQFQLVLEGWYAGLKFLTVNYDTFSVKDKWETFCGWAVKEDTLLILDESHNIKDGSSNRTQNIIRGFCDCKYERERLISRLPLVKYRLAMTGTMIGNSPADAYWQYEFLTPNYFKMNAFVFAKRYTMQVKRTATIKPKPEEAARGKKPRQVEYYTNINRKIWQAVKAIPNDWKAWGNYASFNYNIDEDTFRAVHEQEVFDGVGKNLSELKEKIAPCTLTILKKDCLDLPAVIYEKRVIGMSRDHRKFYNALCSNMLAKLDNKVITTTSAIELLMRLRQAASGFVPMEGVKENGDIEKEIISIAKENMKYNTMVNELSQCEGSNIVVVQFTAEANWIYKQLGEDFPDKVIGINTGSRHEYGIGGEAEEDGKAVVSRFKEGKVDILVANQQTICTGLNLQNCHNMHFYSNGFSLLQRCQIEDRINRIGQNTNPVYIDYLYEDSVDNQIYSALRDKKNILEELQGKDTKVLKEFLKGA